MKKVLLLILVATSFMLNAEEKASVFYDASQFPLLGKGVGATTQRYVRLPDSLENITRKPVWNLSRSSSGMAVRFASNSTEIKAKWKSRDLQEMNHMTDTGIRGLDLYCLQDDGTWTFVNSARPAVGKKNNNAKIVSNMDAKEREYMLYLSLYDGVDSLEIGIDSLSHISSPKVMLPVTKKPVVFYGTSILQGGCASRPGMAHTNILERWLNRETINFGFSGNGRLDLEIAEVIKTIDAGMFVLDFVSNASVDEMNEKMVKFYRIIRDANPRTPILFIEDPHFTHCRFDKYIANEVNRKNQTVNAIYKTLKKSGEKNIYFLKSDKMLGDDNEATVDGIHFTDMGFTRYSELLYPIIKKLIKE
ncbi:MAG: SGNH/GDSL hydrolase family protein [Muribaculaceae bacterium]